MGQSLRILTLDPARVCGWAFGETGASIGPAEFGARKLANPGDAEEAAANVGPWLRDMVRRYEPTHLIVEMFMNPAAQKHASAAVGQLLLHGGIYATARCFGLPLFRPTVATARKFVCGKANAGNRDATKQMVINRLRLIKAIPADCTDDNLADAVCLWVYWAQRHGKVTPQELVLFQD